MKNLTIGIFHDDTLGRELGKKGTESDILMFNRKTDTSIFTFMQPVGDKLSAKTQIISDIDTAIVSCSELTPEVGETILLLDAVGVKDGIIIVPEFSDQTKLKAMIKGTSLETFTFMDRFIPKILEHLEKLNVERNSAGSPIIIIDHSFSVKGVGEVILGLVKRGTVHKHDKLALLPDGKEVLVRSIQMQDADFDSAEAGCRVGLAMKGASVDELRRGAILTFAGEAKAYPKIALTFTKNKFYSQLKEGLYHVTVGMQTVPVTVTNITDNSIMIESEKPIAYTTNDVFLLLDLNARKLHFVGKGKVSK